MYRKTILTLAAFATLACSKKKDDKLTIPVEPVTRQTIVVDAEATGVVEPINVIEVKSKSSGQIVAMPVETGTYVKPGDLLVQLDTRDTRNAYAQAKADLDAAVIKLRVSKTARDRAAELFKERIITSAENEAAEVDYANSQATVLRNRAALDLRAQSLEDATVRAPVAGTVIEKDVALGQVIASGTGTFGGGTTILKMADLTKVRVRTLVNETDIGNVRAGLPATVTVDAFPDRPFTGVVEKIEPQATIQQSVTMFPVLVSIDNVSGLLMPGMNGEVSIETQRRDNALAVSNDAVRSPNEASQVATLLGLNPDTVRAQLASQRGTFGGQRAQGGNGQANGGQAADPQSGSAQNTAQQSQGGAQNGGQGRQGGFNLPEVTDEQCQKVTATLAKHPDVQTKIGALDIPVVGRVNNLFRRVEPKDTLIIDGDNGTIFVRPGEDIRQNFLEGMRARSQRKAMFAATRELPAVTRDGVAISLNINAGLLIDVPHLHDSGADGVGLYRTEIPFMARSEFPDVAAQTDIYRKILSLAGDRPVVFRTLDVGGDKVLPYWRGEDEENPAMGWRAIRIGLDRPIMLRQQLRALLRAAAERPLHVMFPMISEVSEFVAARRMLDLELKRIRTAGKPVPSEVRVGAMFEVPALAWQLKELLSRVDFLSIGSNDLRQFLFASDRSSPRIADRYDTLSPAMLGILELLVRECGAAGKPISLCGEMAGQPVDAMALIGLGFRTLSMAPPAVGPVKTMIRSLDLARLQTYLTGIRGSAGSLRGRLRAFARDHNVAL